MYFSRIFFLIVTTCLAISSCKKDVSFKDQLILATWDCIDYADSVDNKFKGKPPVFISNLYEIGYVFKQGGLMWTRNKNGDNKMFTDKSVACEWTLSEENNQLILQFPGNMIETYEIIELTRKKMTLRGLDGFWGSNKSTYIFEKQ